MQQAAGQARARYDFSFWLMVTIQGSYLPEKGSCQAPFKFHSFQLPTLT
jgi:hypothetical protein